MWRQYGRVWVLLGLPMVTVEPRRWMDGRIVWFAFCRGRRVRGLPASLNSEELKRMTFDYFDARVDLEVVS